MRKILGIIPARYASTRLPGKPLIDLAGKSMIERVYTQALMCSELEKVVVATDDLRIYNHVHHFGGKAVMTDSSLPSGTDRCQAAVELLNWEGDYVVNIQGDEPLLQPEQITLLCDVLKDDTELATLVRPESNTIRLSNFNEVKVVLNRENEALYFSRSWIPAQKNVPQQEWALHHEYLLHIGLYAYRTDVLKKITSLPVGILEQTESLEQLRWLEAGFKIKCARTMMDIHSVDTPEDVKTILSVLRQ